MKEKITKKVRYGVIGLFLVFSMFTVNGCLVDY
jgi:hypothetical protein